MRALSCLRRVQKVQRGQKVSRLCCFIAVLLGYGLLPITLGWTITDHGQGFTYGALQRWEFRGHAGFALSMLCSFSTLDPEIFPARVGGYPLRFLCCLARANIVYCYDTPYTIVRMKELHVSKQEAVLQEWSLTSRRSNSDVKREQLSRGMTPSKSTE